jgi:hypothetical protein
MDHIIHGYGRKEEWRISQTVPLLIMKQDAVRSLLCVKKIQKKYNILI